MGISSLSYEETKKLENLLKELILLARPPVLRKQTEDINKVIETVCEKWSERCKTQNIKLIKELEPEIITTFDVELMKKALDHIFKVAINSIPDSGTITVKTQLCWDSILITIADTGKGLKPWQIKNITQPLSSPTGEIEAALVTARKIVEDHAGKFTIESEPNKGTQILIELPIEFVTIPPI